MTKELLDQANKINGKIGRVNQFKEELTHRVEMIKREQEFSNDLYTEEEINSIFNSFESIMSLLTTKLDQLNKEFTDLNA